MHELTLALNSSHAFWQLQGDFSAHYAAFRGAVQALAALDALHSLATVACNAGCGQELPGLTSHVLTVAHNC